MDKQKIINDVGEWIKDSNIEIAVESENRVGNDSGYEFLILELYGEPVRELAEKFGDHGKLKLRWILPRFENGNCVINDFQTGEEYSSGYIFRRPEFDKGKHENIAPLRLCPDLEKGQVFPAWYRDIEFKWKRFAKAANPKCYINEFIRLEAGLNAIFTNSSARQAGKFIKNDSLEENPLLKIENQRQVLIDWPSETLGRLRIPHLTHKNRLCPFETPESKRTGLQLNLAADATVDNGKIRPGDELFSIAVGLIPYPKHTDGPRLMMGGKNMKQAEIGIAGAEAPIVPGYYEGRRSRDIRSVRPYINVKDKRFFPYLGLNALTVIMPWEGYTYEDGLVISESLAERFCIKKSSYTRSKTFDVILHQIDLNEIGVGTDFNSEKLNGIFKFEKNKKYVYGDILPRPSLKFYSKDNPELERNWNEYYDHHAAGVLENVEVRHVVKKISGRKKNLSQQYNVEFNVSWNFCVERKMGLGDKITGRNGNKGVITKILPDKQMPHVEFSDGEILPAELIISPCSILGRKNFGQIWEMTHSLLIKKGGSKLKKFIDENDINIADVQIDEFEEIVDRLSEFLQETGCDEYGTFKIIADGKPEIRAFAGWQYFCRLHHHSWKKLQARGVKAPYDSTSGQPSKCGALTGQRMGEMENWSLLSHGAFSILSAMRKKQNGTYDKTRELFKKILRSLGISVIEEGSKISFVPSVGEDVGLQRKNLRNALDSLDSKDEQSAFCGIIDNDSTCKSLAEKIRDKLNKERETNENPHIKSIIKKLDSIINNGNFFNKDGSLHIEPEVLNYSAQLDSAIPEEGSIITSKKPQLKNLLLEFYMNGSDCDRAQALINYNKGLIQLLSHKTGVPRFYMLGRRYNHSGRAVIVPEPSLEIDNVYIPAAMLIELLQGYDDIYVNAMPKAFRDLRQLRKIFNDFDNHREEAKSFAVKLNEWLNSSLGELWCFMIRQPSLHRHSVQAFKINCWEFPVIGIPPLVTPGFNADFDGDTMAVFLPPYEQAQNLKRYSILDNPGLVGDGRSAFSDSLDLALGWWKIHKCEKLSQHIAKLLKNKSNLSEELHKLQEAVAKNSSGSATLSPLEFNYLLDKNHSLDDDFCSNINGINVLITSGAKGSRKDLEKTVRNLGEIDMMQDDDKDSETMRKEFISGNWWKGLSDEEMFKYSYPSRFSMAQKKLSVAEAGYLSRLLAEKLYELTVNKDDCGTSQGLEITYSPEHDRFLINGEVFPTFGDSIQDLERILWGRVLLGSDECLNHEKIIGVFESLKKGEKVIIRSPIYCKERENGHICKKCYGADVALKPFDKPELVYEGFCAGITAAQAIGERGTQLAMKRFHSAETSVQNPIQKIKKLLVNKKQPELSEIIREILTDAEHSANKELLQSIIHFEVAAAYLQKDSDNNYLSELAGERIAEKIAKILTEREKRDDLGTMKSKLLWQGGRD